MITNKLMFRLDKDLFYYGKEATEEEAKINEMITANADEYDIKQLVFRLLPSHNFIEERTERNPTHDSWCEKGTCHRHSAVGRSSC